MASSQKTLDLDILTYDQLYLKAQSVQQISSYTIPVIPGGSNVYKLFQYLTPEQTLSTGGILFNQSTIPDISNAILTLNRVQSTTNIALSSLSTSLGLSINIVQSTTNLYFSSATGYTYGPTYSNILTTLNTLQGYNIQTLNLQGTIFTLGTALSTISSQFNPTFCTFGITLDQTFNQGPAVSTLSTYITNYYSNISATINTYSTTIGRSVSSLTFQDISTIQGNNTYIQNLLQGATGSGISTLSTSITSTLNSFSTTIGIYDPSVTISSISSFVVYQLSSLSSYYILKAGTTGLSTLSTFTQRNYLNAITNAQNTAGTPGLCSMSTYVGRIFFQVSTGVGINQSAVVSTFSTTIQNEISMIYTAICTVGYTYVILQQETVKTSISSLSTSFGRDYTNLTNLCTFSSLLGPALSTINTTFNLQSPYSTLQRLSTLQLSNTSTLLNYMSSVYPAIYSGAGLSSLSSFINPNFSSISTSLAPVFSSFSNSIYNISSLRTDTGVSSLSSFVGSNTSIYFSSFQVLYTSTNILSQNNAQQQTIFTEFSNYYVAQIPLLDTRSQIADLTSNISTFGNEVTSSFSTLLTFSQNTSTSVSTTSANLVSSYAALQSSFNMTVSELVSSYTSVSSIVEQNIFSPTFSTFTTDSITTSNLTVNTGLYLSSLGILTSTSSEYPLSLTGSMRIYPTYLPNINHVMVGRADGTITLDSIFINSLNSKYVSSPNNGFTYGALNAGGFDVAYNGSLWVAVGLTSDGTAPIKYTTDPSLGWSNAILTGVPLPHPFPIRTVKWNGSYWLAGAGPTNLNFLQSTDGITWSNVTPLITMDSINGLAWNGFAWVAVGLGSNINLGNNIFYTDPTGAWNSNAATFTAQGNAVTTNGRTWVAVGQGLAPTDPKLLYSYDTITWTVPPPPHLSSAQTVAWNGDKFLAGGSNGNTSNLLVSYTGATWSYVPVPVEQVTAIVWDGSLWNVSGLSTGVGKYLTSADALTWSTVNIGISTSAINGMAFASNTTPAIRLSNFDIYSSEIPVMLDSRKRMTVIQSTIYFNDGNLTIRNLQGQGLIGINTTYPEYSLDLATGNARKPVGTTWVTASDARVKHSIKPADLRSCATLVSQLPLRQYTFTQEFQDKTKVTSSMQYGFIAQEIKKILPGSVSYTKEHGLDDFHSLDTDQIHKLEFGATQYLLEVIARLESQVSTLEHKHL
jgi:hypothetical protein